MWVQSKKTAFFLSVLGGILLIVLSYMIWKPNILGFLKNGENLPVAGLRITIDVEDRDVLFDKLKKFSDQHELKYDVSFFDASKRQFLLVMYGDGFHISARPLPNAAGTIRIFLYNERSTPLPQETIAKLMGNLKNDINEISNIEMVEVK